MNFVFCHVGSEDIYPTILVKSLRQHNPDATIIQCSDAETKEIEGVDRVFRLECDASNLMLFRLECFARLHAGEAAYLDTDMICVAPIRPEIGDNDVMVCARSYGLSDKVRPIGYGLDLTEYRDKTYGEVYPYLGCVTVTQNNGFWVDCLEQAERLPDKFRKWFCDQEVIRDAVNSGDYKVGYLPENKYACLLDKDENPDPVIIHFKGKDRKPMMLDCAARAGLIEGDNRGIVGPIKSIGVMREERIEHVQKNVVKTPKRIPNKPLTPHDLAAVVVCYGPSLKDTWPKIKKARKLGATVVSVSGAHDFLRKNGITPDIHIECDPRAHKGKMIKKRSKDTKYLMASCCHPDVIDQLTDHDLTLWHLYNGQESFDIHLIRSEFDAAMIPGGGSVGLRSVSLLYYLGFRNFVIHGMDCSFDGDEQHAGSHSGKAQKTIKVHPAIVIDDKRIESKRKYSTSPVLISYANQMLKDLREGRFAGANFFWYGDGMFQEMLRLQNMQLSRSKDYVEPKEAA